MNCNVIGAGRLGKNIALALSTTKLISSFSICNRSLASTQNACLEIGFGKAVAQIDRLPEAEITWICCNDDAIQSVVETLVHSPTLKPNSFIIHCSGVFSSALLAPLRKKGCFIGSFHPLKAFKINYLESTAFEQVNCVLEGDDVVCEWLKNAFVPLGASLIAIKPEAKATYHAAACMASNYLITLAACSEELLLKAGINPQQSRQMIVNLMQGNLDNLQRTKYIPEALTGPLARGDIATISLHLKTIQNDKIRDLYQEAGLNTLPLTQLSGQIKEQLKVILTQKCFSKLTE
ncbi:Rossmann-like domain protein [Legionella sainthelensi]|uniref:Rossmann-like domain protein n=1 Tax=Legionella sainthelensi TaxID=28087 RepID=A0A0W0YKV4_9GAMM|nr:Rossmann-like and DUF2520 domain-containing protein [Legionella sainthelensi]KTD57190.1 Rossmann-like domain protein [Legionella sainthelensi]VEH37528.1 Uncharacterized conserved protein [Legionella sainthelensi]